MFSNRFPDHASRMLLVEKQSHFKLLVSNFFFFKDTAEYVISYMGYFLDRWNNRLIMGILKKSIQYLESYIIKITWNQFYIGGFSPFYGVGQWGL